MVASGDGRLLLRVGGDERAELRGVPDARDLVADAEARALLAPILAYGDVTRLTAAPPGVPPDRIEALRAAYEGALRDPELLAQAQALGRSIVPADADTVAQMVDATLAAPPETIASIRQLLDCAPTDDDCP